MPRRFQLLTRCCQPGTESMPNSRPNAASPPAREIRTVDSDGVIGNCHLKRDVYRSSNTSFNDDVNDLFRVGAMKEVLTTKRALKMAAERGFNQTTFQNALDVTPQTFTNWKRRGTIPSQNYANVANVLKCSIDELLGRDRDPTPPGWPFPAIPPGRFYALTEGERFQVQGVMLDKIRELEDGKRGKGPRPRIVTG